MKSLRDWESSRRDGPTVAVGFIPRINPFRVFRDGYSAAAANPSLSPAIIRSHQKKPGRFLAPAVSVCLRFAFYVTMRVTGSLQSL